MYAAILLPLTLALIRAATETSAAGAAPAWLSTGVAADDRPCQLFRTAFKLDALPAEATLRIVGLGHYDVFINGRRVGDSLLNQPWSQYDKSLYVQQFSVRGLLRDGENAIGVMLGNSFWRVGPVNDPQRFSKTDAMPDFSNGRNYLLWAELAVKSAAGAATTVVTDERWRWTDGPVTFSHIYAGEDYDARREIAGWSQPGFDDSKWSPAALVDAPSAKLVDFDAPPIRAFETFTPKQIHEPAPGVFTYEFPQNCSSMLRFTVDGPPGATIRFKPCEYMDPAHRVKFTYTWGTNKDIWLDYTLRGGRPETHQAVFFYTGSQYVEVTGAVPAGRPNPDGLPVIRSLEQVHVRAACPQVGRFSCSSPLQNKAHELIDWSIRSNMAHVASDCPHREKNGWQEQNWHMARALSYRYDTRDWMRKITRDIRDTQLPDGHIPTNCPNYLVGVPPHGYWNEAPEWGVAGVLVPWHLYEWYGDKHALADSFDSMCRYVDYLGTLAKDGAITSNLGDWYDYGHGKGDGPSQWTPAEVSATAIWALAADTCARAAEVLGKDEHRAKYRATYSRIQADFQRRFYDPTTATVRNNGSCQAGSAAALCAGLIPEADRPRTVAAIVADLEKREYQQTTGEVLHVFLIRALADAGRDDVLHRIYARTERGSYGHMVHSGLTTLPESWDAKPGTGNSMNHFMLGHLVEWHLAYVAGIRQQPGSVGWRRILVAPRPGPLDRISASFESPSGQIAVEVRRAQTGFEATVTVPEKVDSAIAQLPDRSTVTLVKGENKLSWPAE